MVLHREAAGWHEAHAQLSSTQTSVGACLLAQAGIDEGGGKDDPVCDGQNPQLAVPPALGGQLAVSRQVREQGEGDEAPLCAGVLSVHTSRPGLRQQAWAQGRRGAATMARQRACQVVEGCGDEGEA